MKIIQAAAALLLCTALPAYAVPVNYTFTSTWRFEVDIVNSVPPGTSTSIPVAPEDRYFAPGDVVAGSFTYDSEAPLTGGGPGIFAFYNTAMTNFAVSLGGYDISFANTAGVINTSADTLTFGRSALGLTIDSRSLTTVALLWADNPTDGENFDVPFTLPATLPPPNFSSLENILAFQFSEPGSGVTRQVTFGSLVYTQVREPQSFALAAIGLLALGFFGRRRRFLN